MGLFGEDEYGTLSNIQSHGLCLVVDLDCIHGGYNLGRTGLDYLVGLNTKKLWTIDDLKTNTINIQKCNGKWFYTTVWRQIVKYLLVIHTWCEWFQTS